MINVNNENKEILKAFLKAKKEVLDKGTFKKESEAKGGEKYGYKYLDLVSILDVVEPILNTNNLLLTFSVDESNRFGATLFHGDSGQSMSWGYGEIPKESRGGSASQSWGMALSYARRYTLLNIFNIVGEEDTDGMPPAQGEGNQSSSNQGGYQPKEGFEKNLTGSFQIKDISLGNLTSKKDKRHSVITLMDGRKWECYPEIKDKQGKELSEWDLRLEALKKLIYFNKAVEIKLGINIQNACGITNEEVKIVLREKADKSKSTILFQEGQPSALPPLDVQVTPPAIGSPEMDEIPF